MPVLRVKSREGNTWGKLAESILNPLTSKHRIIMRKLLNMPEYIQQKKAKGSLMQTLHSLRTLNPNKKMASKTNIPSPQEKSENVKKKNVKEIYRRQPRR